MTPQPPPRQIRPARDLTFAQHRALSRMLWLHPEPAVLRYMAATEPGLLEPVKAVCYWAGRGPLVSIGGIGVDLGAGGIRASYRLEVRMRAGAMEQCSVTLWPPHPEMPAVTLRLRQSMRSEQTWRIEQARVWSPRRIPGEPR